MNAVGRKVETDFILTLKGIAAREEEALEEDVIKIVILVKDIR